MINLAESLEFSQHCWIYLVGHELWMGFTEECLFFEGRVSQTAATIKVSDRSVIQDPVLAR